MTQKFSIDAQLEEVRMAIADYPGLNRGGTISKSKIDFRIERMKAVCMSLAFLKENRDAFLAWQKELRTNAPQS